MADGGSVASVGNVWLSERGGARRTHVMVTTMTMHCLFPSKRLY